MYDCSACLCLSLGRDSVHIKPGRVQQSPNSPASWSCLCCGNLILCKGLLWYRNLLLLCSSLESLMRRITAIHPPSGQSAASLLILDLGLSIQASALLVLRFFAALRAAPGPSGNLSSHCPFSFSSILLRGLDMRTVLGVFCSLLHWNAAEWVVAKNECWKEAVGGGAGVDLCSDAASTGAPSVLLRRSWENPCSYRNGHLTNVFK